MLRAHRGPLMLVHIVIMLERIVIMLERIVIMLEHKMRLADVERRYQANNRGGTWNPRRRGDN
jgi:hypothetical protein